MVEYFWFSCLNKNPLLNTQVILSMLQLPFKLSFYYFRALNNQDFIFECGVR